MVFFLQDLQLNSLQLRLGCLQGLYLGNQVIGRFIEAFCFRIIAIEGMSVAQISPAHLIPLQC